MTDLTQNSHQDPLARITRSSFFSLEHAIETDLLSQAHSPKDLKSHIEDYLKGEIQARIDATWDCPLHIEVRSMVNQFEIDTNITVLAVAAPTQPEDVQVGELLYYLVETPPKERKLTFNRLKRPTEYTKPDTSIQFEKLVFERVEIVLFDEYLFHFWKRIQ